jgi:hypothetical protein
VGQAHVVQDCASRGNPKREEIVVIGTVAVAADGGVGTTGPIQPTPIGGVPVLLKDALEWIGYEDGIDILMAHVPATLPIDAFPPLLKTLESIVELGQAKSYGISTTAFTALDAPGDRFPALPIRKLFAAAERCSQKHNLTCVAYECVAARGRLAGCPCGAMSVCCPEQRLGKRMPCSNSTWIPKEVKPRWRTWFVVMGLHSSFANHLMCTNTGSCFD